MQPTGHRGPPGTSSSSTATAAQPALATAAAALRSPGDLQLRRCPGGGSACDVVATTPHPTPHGTTRDQPAAAAAAAAGDGDTADRVGCSSSARLAEPQPPRSTSSDAGAGTQDGDDSSAQPPPPPAAAKGRCRRSPTRLQRLAQSERVSDVLDAASLALTLASLTLSAVLCALCFAHPSLAWAGVALLVAAVAAPVAVGSIILARNHWLIVVLRYCCSVSGLQADSGLSLAAVRPPALRRCLSALLSAALALVGVVVGAYLGACYLVTAVLSVPLLDVSLLASLLPPLRRRALAGDLVLLESYKATRAVVSATLQALPLAVVSALLLAAAHTGGPALQQQEQQSIAAAVAAAAAANGTMAAVAAGAVGGRAAAPAPPPAAGGAISFAQSSSDNSSSTVWSSSTSAANSTKLSSNNTTIGSSSSSNNSSSSFHSTGNHRRLLLTPRHQQERQQDRIGVQSAAILPEQQQQHSSRRAPPSAARVLLAEQQQLAGGSGGGRVSTSVSSPPPAMWDARAIGHMLASLLGLTQPPPSPAAAGAAKDGGSSDSGLRPTGAILSTDPSQGRPVTLTLLLPAVAAGAAAPSNSSSSSDEGDVSSGAAGGRPWLSLVRPVLGSRRYQSGSSSSSTAAVVTVATPAWAELGAAAASVLPLPLLAAAVGVALADVALVLLLLLAGCRRARLGVCRQIGLTWRLAGGLKLPRCVAAEASSQLRKDGGRLLHISNVYNWSRRQHQQQGGTAGSSRSKLPLVPRYLFPPDGGWLVPGQMCFLAVTALSSSSDGTDGSSSSSSSSDGAGVAGPAESAAVEELEVDHAAAGDLAVLLSAAGRCARLAGLRCLSLNWCRIGTWSLSPLLQGQASTSLVTLTLKRCELSDAAAGHLAALLQSPGCSLKTLALLNCRVSAEAAARLARGLGGNASLSSLRFSGNAGGKPAALAFAGALRDNATLAHLNLSYNKLCPSGGEALAAALTANALSAAAKAAAAAATAAASAGSSSARGLQRLVVQRKEVGGAGLKATIAALRQITGYSGGLTLRVLSAPGIGSGSTGTSSRWGADARLLQLVELPVVFVCHEDQEMLLAEAWLEPLLLLGSKQHDHQQQQQQQEEGGAKRHSLVAASVAVVDDVAAAASSSSGSSRPGSSGSGSSSDSDSSRPGTSSSSSGSSEETVVEIRPASSSFPSTQSSSSSSKRLSGFAAAANIAAASNQLAPPTAHSSGLANAPTDGLTPACSGADCLLVTAASSSSSSSSGGDVSAVGMAVTPPQLVFLSQNDPGDSVAAVLRHVAGVTTVDLSGLQLSSKGVRSIAAALPEAHCLMRLLLPGTGLLDDGAAALAAALLQPPSPLASPPASRSGSSGGGAAALLQLDLSDNTVCDTGAVALLAALRGGALPRLQQLRLVGNRYPLDWEVVVALQQLEALLPGCGVDLGAPSSWCASPAAVGGSSGGQGARLPLLSGQQGSAPAGWAPPAAAAAAAAASSGITGGGGSCADSTASEDLCGVCLDAANALRISSCSHQLCIGCYRQLVKAAAAAAAGSSSRQQQQGQGRSTGCASCPFCRQPVTGFTYASWGVTE